MPLRSTASYRGSVYDHVSHRLYVYESKPERGFIWISLASNEIADYHEQPPEVEFLWPDGRKGRHTFDALLLLTTGLRVAVDVKPLKKIVSSGIFEIQRLIEEQVGSGFADIYVVRTEEHIHEDDVADAQIILRARQFSCPASDARVAQLVTGLYGWCRLRDLVAASGIGASAYHAAVRMIDERLLEVRGDARISYESFVRRSRA